MQRLPPESTWVEILSSFPDEIREKALTNAGYKPEEWLPKCPYVTQPQMAQVLSSAFEWMSTPEDHDFWEDWYYKLIGNEIL